ncbi:tyrosine-protein phosphatase [Vagococcus coleopterorum]|uniref:Tyrosine-protein phosphatase n=1 Tax=Vagococcus coleopterorum TaxID=2714946 RepID=A0A6G8AMX1_9ENTE|nr:tyrosine-protein phosphatase [Vagococcus coleopterorum]QIL46320.1 tyrosine-protein phosphatase [Vagococcus coleopterorum]
MKTLVNFRDVGGLVTKDNRRVVMGKILRSGELVGLSEEARKTLLKDYQLKTIFDFRGADEVNSKPDDKLTGVEYHNIDIMKDCQGNSASFEDLMSGLSSAKEHMLAIYRDILVVDSGLNGYRVFLETIAKKDEPFIFHCFAGKDRTGIGAMLILEILGVDKKDIYEDYLATNEMRQDTNQKILTVLANEGMTPEQLEEAEVMLLVDSEYLDLAYEIMLAKHETVEAFIINQIGLSSEYLEMIRANYTEDTK